MKVHNVTIAASFLWSCRFTHCSKAAVSDNSESQRGFVINDEKPFVIKNVSQSVLGPHILSVEVNYITGKTLPRKKKKL